MSYWENKRVLVTGGSGFLGAVLVQKLRGRECLEIIAPRSRDFDLRDAAAVAHLLEQTRPSVVIHLAAMVGGIEANRRNPGRFFYDNAIMGMQLMDSLGAVWKRAAPTKSSVSRRVPSFARGWPRPSNGLRIIWRARRRLREPLKCLAKLSGR